MGNSFILFRRRKLHLRLFYWAGESCMRVLDFTVVWMEIGSVVFEFQCFSNLFLAHVLSNQLIQLASP